MNKKDIILKTALRLFSQFGLHATPTSKIALDSNVSNGTLFNYFKTKEELIIELYFKVKFELNENLQSFLHEEDLIKTKIKKIFTLALIWGLNHEEEISFLQLISTTPNLNFIPADLKKQSSFFHESLLQKAIDENLIRNIPIDLISDLASGHFFSALPFIRKTAPINRNEEIERVFELFWRMIAV